MPYLQQVQYLLPNTDTKFTAQFFEYFETLGSIHDNSITFRLTDSDYFPQTILSFIKVEVPKVIFALNDGTSITTNIENVTKEQKQNSHQYTPLSLTHFKKRISSFRLVSIDHTGFNLPYFQGIHPQILELRQQLKSLCLYHTFPKHLEDAPWDFILPGDQAEIVKEKEVNYSLSRKPKIEIVSFDKASTPLIQFDLQVEGGYEELAPLFPEAIQLADIKSVWVYIENKFGIDICFVLNEADEKDWSYHFANSRLT